MISSSVKLHFSLTSMFHNFILIKYNRSFGSIYQIQQFKYIRCIQIVTESHDYYNTLYTMELSGS